MMVKTFGLLIVSLVWAMVACGPTAHAECRADEYSIKAAFIYNFAKFVEWPDKAFADADAPMTVGIFRDDAFAQTFERMIKGKTIDGRQLAIKRFEEIGDIQKCHILFVCSSAGARTREVLDRVKDWNVLTIGEADGFARRGGVINFVEEDKKIRFEINVNAAKKAGLKISSKLLKLAKIVEG